MRVALWVSQNYDEAGYEKFFRGADFVLVGYALAHNHIVVTQENTKGGKSKVKIPDACDAMGVECINTWDLLKAECPNFILGGKKRARRELNPYQRLVKPTRRIDLSKPPFYPLNYGRSTVCA